MSRRAEPSVFAGRLDAAALEARGYRRCEHCDGLLPLNVSRCRRRQCSGYAATWARDTMRKTRENLRTYGGLACMCTLTAPGQEAGLVWDRRLCRHPEGVTCSGKLGCRVSRKDAEALERAFEGVVARAQPGRQAARRSSGAAARSWLSGRAAVYEWELQGRGVRHLHFVLGMETPVERVWAFEYQRYWHESERQAYRVQNEFRELWPS